MTANLYIGKWKQIKYYIISRKFNLLNENLSNKIVLIKNLIFLYSTYHITLLKYKSLFNYHYYTDINEKHNSFHFPALNNFIVCYKLRHFEPDQ